MEKIIIADFDPAEYIETKEDVLNILEATLEENDPEFLLSVIGDIARSKGITEIAKELNLDRAGLYRSLSPAGNPSFTTVVKVLGYLGFQLNIQRNVL